MHLANYNLRLLRVVVWCSLVVTGCLGGPGLLRAQTLLKYRRPAEPAQAASTVPAAAPAPAWPTVTPSSASGVSQRSSRPASSRRLAPPSPGGKQPARGERPAGPRTAFALPQIESLTTAGTGLAIVLGLLMICLWLLRRSGPNPTAALPADAIRVLGRLPLAGRNFAQLLQVGQKLVLVGITAEGMTPLAEVSDPSEVDRLLGVCLRNHKSTTSVEFQQVLEQLAQEPAEGFLGSAAKAYAPISR